MSSTTNVHGLLWRDIMLAHMLFDPRPHIAFAQTVRLPVFGSPPQVAKQTADENHDLFISGIVGADNCPFDVLIPPFSKIACVRVSEQHLQKLVERRHQSTNS